MIMHQGKGGCTAGKGTGAGGLSLGTAGVKGTSSFEPCSQVFEC